MEMNEISDWEQVSESQPAPPPPPQPYSDDLSVFPPSNHEGLRAEEFQSQPSNPPFPEGNVADRLFPLSVPRLWVAGESAKRHVLLGFQDLYSNFLRLRFSAPSSSLGRAVGSFPAATTATGVAVVAFLWWLKRRRGASAEKEEIVILLIRENQKKLDQLLQEIAQIKEIMSMQHKVPFFRRIVNALLLGDS